MYYKYTVNLLMVTLLLGILSACSSEDEITTSVTEVVITATYSPYSTVTDIPVSTVLPVPTDIPSTESLPPSSTPAPVLPSCPEGRLAIEASDEGNHGIYIACPDIGSIEYMLDLSQYDFPGGFNLEGDTLLFFDENHMVADELIMVNLSSFESTMIISQNMGKKIRYTNLTSDRQYVGYVSLWDGDPEQEKGDVIEFLYIPTLTVSRFEIEGGANLVGFQWSRDGREILYINSAGGNTDLTSSEYGAFLANVSCENETGQCEVTNRHLLEATGSNASFSFDASQIVSIWQPLVDGNRVEAIVITDLSSRVIRRVMMHEIYPALEFIHNPIFSPDGTRIAFDAEAVGTGIRNVYILDLEQITVTDLTNNTSIDKYFRVVAWSEG